MPTPIIIGDMFDVSGHSGSGFTIVSIVKADHIEAGRGEGRPAWRLLTLHSPEAGYACGFVSGKVVDDVFMSDTCALCIRGTVAESPEVSLAHLLAKMTDTANWHARRMAIVADEMASAMVARLRVDEVEARRGATEEPEASSRLSRGFLGLEFD